MRTQILLVAALALGCAGPKKTDLSVTGSPTGAIEGELEIVLSFTKAMVGDEKIGALEPRPPLTIEPALAGEATWRDAQTLVFRPSVALPISTEFVARVPEGTKARDGHVLDDDFELRFHSERLAASFDIMGSDRYAVAEQQVKLTFNHEVAFASVSEQCHFVAQGKEIAVRRPEGTDEEQAKEFILIPAEALALDTDWVLLCKASLQATEGNLGLEADASGSFHTYGPLAFLTTEPAGNDIVPDEDLYMEVAFTNPLAKPYAMKLEPAVPGFPERCHVGGDAPPSLSCPLILDANTSYTLTIAPEQKDIFGQTIGKEVTTQFRTTDAEPTVSLESGYFVAELRRPVFPIWSRNIKNLDVVAVAVTPDNFHKVSPLLDWWNWEPTDFGGTGLKPVTKKYQLPDKRNQWQQFALDPSDLLGKAPGPGMYLFEVGSDEATKGRLSGGDRGKILVNFTDIGIVSKVSGTKGLVWATRLSTGEPLPGASVTVRNAKGKVTWTGVTGADGTAVLPGRARLEQYDEEEYGSLHVYVKHQRDWSMVNVDRSGSLASWNFNISSEADRSPVRLRGFMHTDRGLYRPGEKVHIKGIARTTKLGEPLSVPKERKVEVSITGPRGNTIHTSETRLSRFGGFWVDLDIPADARLGDYSIVAKLEHGSFVSRFAVEEYRAATFEVTGKTKKERVVRRGDLEATIAANYFYGAPVRDAKMTMTVHSRPRHLEFEGFEDFSFTDERSHDSYYHYSDYSQELVTEESAALDSSGNATLSVSLSPSDISKDSDLLVRASVTAPSNEVISKTFTVPYFRSRKYFGIKSPGYFLEVGKKQRFEIAAATPNGKATTAAARLTVRRRDWNCVWEDWGYRGSYRCNEIKHDVLSQDIEVSADKPTPFEFTPEGGGEYWIVVEGKKQSHAAAAVQLYAWGDGGGSWQSNDSMTFDIIADKKEYRAGDTATLLLKTDLKRAAGIVTIERDGVIETRPFDLTEDVKHIKVPIAANYAPNVYVSVALVQGRLGDGPRGKPIMRMGLVNLPVRPEGNQLTVEVQPERADYRPGEEVTATVIVKDQSGSPVEAEVSVTAADEGVLSLIGFHTPNPTPTFYSPWAIGVTTATQLAYLRDIAGPNTQRPATGGDSGGPGSVRSRFLSTAVWLPGVLTDKDGRATVRFPAPDNLTAFRLMAVAADDGQRFGSGDKRFTVSKPLQLHRSLPRFLTAGDQLLGGVVVHNETGAAGKATVSVALDGELVVEGAASKTIDVPAGGRVPVLWNLNAKESGNAELTFQVAMGGEKDAVRYSLPIHHPSRTKIHRVAAGASDKEETIALAIPDEAEPESVVVEVSVDPNGLAGIEKGLVDLIEYPYGCLEQTTSRVIPMLAVRDLTDSLDLPELKGDDLNRFVRAGIAKIGRHQTAYGGFSLWPGGHPQAYYTAYALWGLYLAREAGYEVDQTRIDEGLSYLRYDGKRPDEDAPYYNESGNNGSQAFALYVRAMLGDADAQAVTKLMEAESMPLYGKAFLARALAASVGKDDDKVKALVAELGAIAAMAVGKGKLVGEPEEDGLSWYMSDSVRTTAIILDTLVAFDPNHPALDGLSRALMTKLRSSDHLTTQGNLYTLIALANYAKATAQANVVADVRLGEQVLIRGALRGKDRLRSARAHLGDNRSLKVGGSGKVHYSVILRYQQRPETMKAVSKVLSLEREFLDENGAVKTKFKVGDIVKVKLTVPLDGYKNHLMVSDRLPAGFEALNTRLATVGPVGETRRQWGTHRELRDERADFSSEYAWRKEQVSEYLVRATSAGTFALPPSVAELMYDPDEYAQTALGSIVIEPR